MKLLVVMAGTGTPSSSTLLGERLTQAVRTRLEAGGEPVEVTAVELRTLAVDLAQHSGTGVASPALAEALEAVRAADGVIAVTPVYNGSFTGVFKLFFDALDEAVMAGRPVLLGATGGTARHSLVIHHSLVPLFYYLKAIPAPIGVYAATEDWGDPARLAPRIEQAAASFVPLMLNAAPDKEDHDFDVVDFSDLLRG